MGNTTRFFERLRDHSEIKLRILRKFIPPWRAKLGHKVRSRGDSRLWYVDGFAGRGRYDDGSEGSPIIGAQEALRSLQESRGYTLGCVNVELEHRRYEELERNTETYKAAGVALRNLPGDFCEQISVIMEIIRDDPVLVFVDPFGIKPLRMAKLLPLLRREAEIDLMLVFQTPAVYRLARVRPNYVSDAVGDDSWQAQWQTSGVGAVLDVLCRRIKAEGRFFAVANYAVRGERDAAPKYHLVVASRSYDAFLLLNDSICEEESSLDAKFYRNLGQRSFLPTIDREADERTLVEAILQFGRLHERTTRSDIVQYLVIHNWATWHSSQMKRAIGGLIEAEFVERRSPRKIDTDELIFIRGRVIGERQ